MFCFLWPGTVVKVVSGVYFTIERIVSTQVTLIFWRSFPLPNKRFVLGIARAATVLVAIFVTEPGGEVLGGGECSSPSASVRSCAARRRRNTDLILGSCRDEDRPGRPPLRCAACSPRSPTTRALAPSDRPIATGASCYWAGQQCKGSGVGRTDSVNDHILAVPACLGTVACPVFGRKSVLATPRA